MKRILLLAIIATTTGCASIIAPSHQDCEFNTEPVGRTVRVDGLAYTTPAKVSLSTTSTHAVVWPDGSTTQIKQTFQPWVIGNAIFGLVGLAIGIPIDILSGASEKNLTPRKLDWSRDGGYVDPAAARKKKQAEENPKVEPRY